MNKIKRTVWAGVVGASLYWGGLFYGWLDRDDYDRELSYFSYIQSHAETLWINHWALTAFCAALLIGILWSIYAIWKAGIYWLEEYKTNREHKALLRTKQLFNEGILSEDEYEERLARIKAR